MSETKVVINDEQLQQLAAIHGESGIDYSTLINSAINEFFDSFMAELRRAEVREVK